MAKGPVRVEADRASVETVKTAFVRTGRRATKSEMDPPSQGGATTAWADSAMTCELSIVMPCLDEAETVAGCVEQAIGYLRDSRTEGEVVVADNGSTDDSRRLATAAGARVVAVAEPGYGSAVAGGVRASHGRHVIMGDADGSYDFSALAPFVGKLRAGVDLVMGNRFAGGIQPGAMPLLNRVLGNPVLSGLGRLFFHSPVVDFHCGLRGFSRRAFDRMDLQTTGMEFASEMVVKATLLKLKIEEVPVTLSPAGRGRRPHLRPWRDGWRHLRFMLLYSPKWLFLYPGLFLIGAGMVVGGWLLGGSRQMVGITLDIHTLLYAALAVLLGFQAVTFALFTKVYAVSTGLMPMEPGFRRYFSWIKLEAGLLAGSILVVAGLGGSVGAVWFWKQEAFGPLDPSRMFRLIIPAFLSLALGIQVILSSFFLSVLGLRRRGQRFK